MPYTHTYNGNSFPNKIIPTGTKKDIGEASTAILNTIIQLQTYIDNKQYKLAAEYFNLYKAALMPYIDSADYHNILAENLHNTGLMALTTVYQVIDTIEPMQDEMSYWDEPY